jgi:hypothetical protein
MDDATIRTLYAYCRFAGALLADRRSRALALWGSARKLFRKRRLRYQRHDEHEFYGRLGFFHLGFEFELDQWEPRRRREPRRERGYGVRKRDDRSW